MDAVEFKIMNKEIIGLVDQLYKKQCCRQKVGRMRSLSLGFGQKRYHGNLRLNDDFYGEWEIGTYYSAWRVVKNGHILCGSQNVVDSTDELNTALGKIEFGRVDSLHQIGCFDVRLELDNDIAVDFISTISDNDECFHIFCPNNIYIAFSINEGWKISASNKPLKNK
jgi:hypothetical protein